MITKAKKGGLHNHRQVVAYLNDKEIAAKLFDEVGPRYATATAATPASSSSVLVTATTRRWPASNWSDR
jgi:hypothetical protein